MNGATLDRELCKHELDPGCCDVCRNGIKTTRRRDVDTSHHLGSADDGELARCTAIQPRLRAALRALSGGAKSPALALGMIAQQAPMPDHWQQASNARKTIERVAEGYGTKHWALDAIEWACDQVLRIPMFEPTEESGGAVLTVTTLARDASATLDDLAALMRQHPAMWRALKEMVDGG